MEWKKRLLAGALLVIAGMALALYVVAHWDAGQRWLGLAGEPVPVATSAMEVRGVVEREPVRAASVPAASDAADEALDERVASLERAIVRAEGSAGRADGLLVAFAARRAVERGLPLGYLEPLLVERYGRRHEAAVGTLISGAREPILLKDLVEEYQGLADQLRAPPPSAGFGERIKRGFSNLVTVYSANRPNPRPRATYERALVDLRLGQVDSALAETMRLPGAQSEEAAAWIARARSYIATQRALDTIEAAALLSREEYRAN